MASGAEKLQIHSSQKLVESFHFTLSLHFPEFCFLFFVKICRLCFCGFFYLCEVEARVSKFLAAESAAFVDHQPFHVCLKKVLPGQLLEKYGLYKGMSFHKTSAEAVVDPLGVLSCRDEACGLQF